MTRIESMTALARENGWTAWEHGPHEWEDGRTLVSWTYGIHHVACLHVRYGPRGGIINGIYVHFPSSHRDQLIWKQTGKRELIERIIREKPSDIKELMNSCDT